MQSERRDARSPSVRIGHLRRATINLSRRVWKKLWYLCDEAETLRKFCLWRSVWDSEGKRRIQAVHQQTIMPLSGFRAFMWVGLEKKDKYVHSWRLLCAHRQQWPECAIPWYQVPVLFRECYHTLILHVPLCIISFPSFQVKMFDFSPKCSTQEDTDVVDSLGVSIFGWAILKEESKICSEGVGHTNTQSI